MASPVRILMIDDDEEDFIITRDIIEEIKHHSYKIDWSPSYDDGLKKISENKYDVYLVDYRLGAKTGTELIKKAIENGCEKPLILLTGQNNSEVDNEALKAGASDFLVKGSISSRNFENSINYSIAQAQMLQKMKHLNEYLEKKVQERTLVLQEAIQELNKTKQELSSALQKEKELNDLKSRFVSMASHEFRTPLAAILSSLSLAKKYSELGDAEKESKHLERIKTSVNNLTDMISDVLSISKMEEGKISVIPEKFNLKHFVSEIAKELQSVAKEGQTIQLIHNGNGEIFFDKKILRHVMFNLISNAIKFSPEGKAVEVKTEHKDSTLTILVKDSGIGISKEDQKHLFERFFRGENASNIQGTGLGLNIVAKYVELLDGKIECKSELEKGTTFILKFSLANY